MSDGSFADKRLEQNLALTHILSFAGMTIVRSIASVRSATTDVASCRCGRRAAPGRYHVCGRVGPAILPWRKPPTSYPHAWLPELDTATDQAQRRHRRSDLVFAVVRTHIEDMAAANYRMMLTRAGKYCVERTRPGEPASKTSDFATQSTAHNRIERDKEREAALTERRHVAAKHPPWWINLWWRS